MVLLPVNLNLLFTFSLDIIFSCSLSFQAGTTGSIDTSVGIDGGGGTWYTGSGFNATEQFLNDDNLDTNLDVTDICTKWSASLFAGNTYPTCITNNGFILKRSESQEFTAIDDGELNFFSMDTHTIFPPFLELRWMESFMLKLLWLI